jgi:hypothetical protein
MDPVYRRLHLLPCLCSFSGCCFVANTLYHVLVPRGIEYCASLLNGEAVRSGFASECIWVCCWSVFAWHFCALGTGAWHARTRDSTQAVGIWDLEIWEVSKSAKVPKSVLWDFHKGCFRAICGSQFKYPNRDSPPSQPCRSRAGRRTAHPASPVTASQATFSHSLHCRRCMSTYSCTYMRTAHSQKRTNPTQSPLQPQEQYAPEQPTQLESLGLPANCHSWSDRRIRTHWFSHGHCCAAFTPEIY